jgi:hypothetical protein
MLQYHLDFQSLVNGFISTIGCVLVTWIGILVTGVDVSIAPLACLALAAYSSLQTLYLSKVRS